MDPQTSLLILGVGALAWLAFLRAVAGRGRDLSDVMTGLFRHSADLGWPVGVQEEDTIRPWGDPRAAVPSDASAPAATGPTAAGADQVEGDGDPASGAQFVELPIEAVIEDDVPPIEVRRVRRAA